MRATVTLRLVLGVALATKAVVGQEEDDEVRLRVDVTDQCEAKSDHRSPVDLVHPTVDDEAESLHFHNLVFPVTYEVEEASRNHVTLVPIDTGRNLPYVEGGPAVGDGNNRTTGRYKLGFVAVSMQSRHWFAGKAFAMEAEVYFYDTYYKNFREALVNDGVLGIGMLFKEDDPPFGEELLLESEGPRTVRFYSNSLLPKEVGAYYFYDGSFIDTGCHEPVRWVVDKSVRSLSRRHGNKLRNFILDLSAGQSDTDNYYYRERSLVQPLGTRTIYSSKLVKKLPSRFYNQKKRPDNIDHFFLFIMSIIIFFMQCGFAFMEAGAVKSKNTVNILIKNWLDVCIGALMFWATGYAFMYGYKSNSFIGYSYFLGIGLPDYKLSKWFFNFVFAATAATLVSGSLAERCNFVAYIVYSIMITGFIYPVIAHWAWHPYGWLKVNGFHDFAGSGVVHLCGAICALVGCVLMGPRRGRFDKHGNLINMPGHSLPLSALGGFILIFGFFACNGAKQGSISHPEDGITVMLAIVNTALGTSAAGVFTLIFNKTGIVPGTGQNYSLLTTINGSLTGTIALCAGCDVYEQWAAIVVGAMCGPIFIVFKWLLLKYRIDDPLDAIPVHGCGGVLGILAVYVFSPKGILMTWSHEACLGLAWNTIGLLAIVSWTGVTCFVMFWALKAVDMLRVDPEMEFKGMDLIKHGEAAYPAEAWVEQQYGAPDDNTPSSPIGLNPIPGGSRTSMGSGGGGRGSAGGLAALLAGGGPQSNGGFVGEGGMSSSSSSGFLSGLKKKKAAKRKTSGLPPNMKGEGGALYNNAHELFPTSASFFNAMRNVAAGTQMNMERSTRRKNIFGRRGSSDSGGGGGRRERRHSVVIVPGCEDGWFKPYNPPSVPVAPAAKLGRVGSSDDEDEIKKKFDKMEKMVEQRMRDVASKGKDETEKVVKVDLERIGKQRKVSSGSTGRPHFVAKQESVMEEAEPQDEEEKKDEEKEVVDSNVLDGEPQVKKTKKPPMRIGSHSSFVDLEGAVVETEEEEENE